MSINKTERVRRPAEVRWVARLTPTPAVKLADLLAMPLGLDVWERRADELVVAAGDAALGEVERRRLARVERISPVPEGGQPTGQAQPTGQDQGGDR